MFKQCVRFTFYCVLGISIPVGGTGFASPAFAGKTAILVWVSTSGVEDSSLEGEKSGVFSRLEQLSKKTSVQKCCYFCWRFEYWAHDLDRYAEVLE